MGCHEGVEGAGDQQRAFDWPWGFLCEEHLQVAPHTIRMGQQDDRVWGRLQQSSCVKWSHLLDIEP
jgi:hypothetical protein